MLLLAITEHFGSIVSCFLVIVILRKWSIGSNEKELLASKHENLELLDCIKRLEMKYLRKSNECLELENDHSILDDELRRMRSVSRWCYHCEIKDRENEWLSKCKKDLELENVTLKNELEDISNMHHFNQGSFP